MFEPVIDEITATPGRAASDEIALPAGGNATAKIVAENYVPLSAGSLASFSSSPPVLLFVDGGNAPVFDAPEARVEYVRLHAVAYAGAAKKTFSEGVEGFVLVKNDLVDGKPVIVAKGHGGLAFSLLLRPDDEELTLGNERVPLERAANLARFALECEYAAAFAKESSCNVVVRDGPLLGRNRHEQVALEKLRDELASRRIVLAGLAKTSGLLTADGRGAGQAVLQRGPSSPWLYPLGVDSKIFLSLVKLHEKSSYAFRLDVDGDERLARDVAAQLLPLSADPVFFGYPYPLVEADRLARVSNRDVELLSMRFRADAGARWKDLERLSRGNDAHGVLDRIG